MYHLHIRYSTPFFHPINPLLSGHMVANVDVVLDLQFESLTKITWRILLRGPQIQQYKPLGCGAVRLWEHFVI